MAVKKTIPIAAVIVAIFIWAPFIHAEGLFSDCFTLVEDNSSRILLEFDTPAIDACNINLEAYSRIPENNRNFSIVGEPGGSVLPAWSRWIKVPDGMRPIIKISKDEDHVQVNAAVAYFPSLKTDNPYLSGSAVFSDRIESQDKLYPEAPAFLGDIIHLGNERWVLVTVAPYRYNSYREELHTTDRISVEVTFEPDPDFTPQPDRYIPPVYEELRRSVDDSQPSPIDVGRRADHLGRYVVIVPDDEDYLEYLQPLINWKKRKGHPVTVANLADIGNRAEDIATWLQDAWDDWRDPPVFVLLAGDVNGASTIPTFRDFRGPNSGWHASDIQYVSWVGNNGPDEWTPDAFIGRLVPENAIGLRSLVTKQLSYEMDPYTDEDWVEGAVLITNGVHSCTSTSMAIRELMQGVGYIRADILEAYSDWHQGQRPDINAIQNRINRGVGFVNFRGYNNWGDIYPNHIRALDNSAMLPVVTGMVCGTNDFTQTWNDAQPECRGEAWVRAWDNEPIGGISCFGPTDLYTHTWFNNTLDGEFYHLLLNKDVSTLGALCVGAKVALLRNYPSFINDGNGQTVGYYFYTYALLGDPGMQVWSHEPLEVVADFQADLPVGTTLLQFVITDQGDDPIPNAYVHVYRDDDFRLGGFTDSEGTLCLAVDPLEAGEYLLTVTGNNIVPVLESFEVVQSSQFLSITDVDFDDDREGDSNGNENGQINPGETLELVVVMTNTGDERCEGATATLSTTSPWVEIIRNETEYPRLDPDGSTPGIAPFVIHLAPETPDREQLSFNLHVVSGDEEWENGFNLKVLGYYFRLTELLFLEDDLLPGTQQDLLISVENAGDFETNEITATLQCDDPKIQIREAESLLGVFQVDDVIDNANGLFQVYAAPDAFQGSEVSFGLLLADEFGLKDSLVFDVMLGAPIAESPQGGTEYGYWAFECRDTTGGYAPEFDWLPGQENLRLTDNDDRNNYSGTHGSRTLVHLPFEFAYFGQVYEDITVGSNGWLAFGSSDLVSWNNQEIGSGLAPPAMLCPFWEDLWSGQVYTRYDEDNARFIVEWRDYIHHNGRATFAVHLYDPTVVATQTHDGEFYFLYNSVDRMLGRDYAEENVTIGFCSPDRRDGMTIAHARHWDPRTPDLEDECAIRFTTGEYTERGSVTGLVINAENQQPMQDVRVMVDNTGFFSLTEEDGRYRIDRIPIGTYTVTAQRRHYNSANSVEIQVEQDGETEVNFEMTHPTFDTDIEVIRYGLKPDSTGEVDFSVWNEGNGNLDFRLNLDYEAEPPDRRDEEWDFLFGLSATDSTDDSRLQGVTYDGEFFYVTGQLVYQEYPHMIYVLDHDGNKVREFEQYSVDSSANRGYYVLAWNGENLLAAEEENIIELTREGELVNVIPTLEERQRTQAVVWAPERNTIFTKSITGDVFYEMDVEGNMVSTVSTEASWRTYGAAWYPEDPDGFKLYVFNENPYPDEIGGTRLMLNKVNTETEECQLVRFIQLEAGDKPLGCHITKRHNPLLWTFIGLINRSDGDQVVGYELGPNLTWISYDPESGVIESDQRQLFMVQFFTTEMPEREYFVVLQIFHNALGDRYDIPVYFTIDEDWSIKDEDIIQPNVFAFDPPAPNPFNDQTLLSFQIPARCEVTLLIWDITGRLVERRQLGRLNTGKHQFNLDASNLSAGLYLAQINAGLEHAVQKLVLLK